jgi:hypothetical protein
MRTGFAKGPNRWAKFGLATLRTRLQIGSIKVHQRELAGNKKACADCEQHAYAEH